MSDSSLPYDKLRVFISSKMVELRDVREVVGKALADRGIYAWVYEMDAGARPEDVVKTSLNEVEVSDIYVGLFWKLYGEVTVKEYRYARTLSKPCFVYIRDKNCQRQKELDEFLSAEVYDLHQGVTYDYFDSSIKLGERVADNIMGWLVRRHREMTAEMKVARISQDELARLQVEIDRLQATSRERLPYGTAVDYLAQQMRGWFETLGYQFKNYNVQTNDYFEWIIKVQVGRRKYNSVLVRGIEGEAEVSDVIALRQAVDNQKTDEGWLVAIRRISQAARVSVENQEKRDLSCYTFDELLDEDADFDHYLNWLEAEVKYRGIDRMYVPLACTKEEFDPLTKQKIGESHYDEHNGWIDHYIDLWLHDPAKEHISILGEFGTGKTWFALHYAWTALQAYRKAKDQGTERPRLPLFIPLRDYAKAISVESLFSEFFFRKHEIPLPGYSAFERLNRMGKLLLIFDGFDEMAAKIDRQKMINNFWELARVVVPGAKAILTCRTEHFPEAREGRALLNAELQASISNLTGEPPQFEVLELSHFNNDQIRQVLSLRAESKTVKRVMDNPQLLDLARRPVMTELILEALPDIRAGRPVDLSRVYLYAVKHKMERDIKEERTFTSLADKLYFLCELSWEMLSTDQMSLNYRLFPERLRHLFGPIVQEQKDLDHWHYDMMGQTMLIRNSDGDYTPAHRSLLEFFVAYKYAAELGVLAPDFIAMAQAQSHLNKDAASKYYTWSSYFQREMDEKGAIKSIVPLEGFVSERMSKLVETVGKIPITNALLDLIENMLGPDKERVKDILVSIISKTRGKTIKDVGFIGGNSAALLVRCNPLSLKGRDLSETNLNHVDLSGADLTNCNLYGAYLQNAQFRNTTLRNADLRRADLTFSRFSEMKDVRSVSFSTNGTLLASGGDDNHVHIWEVVSARELHTLTGHKLEIHRVVFDKTGHFLGTLSDDSIQIWNIRDMSLACSLTTKEFSLESFKALCFNPTNSCEVTIGGISGIVTFNINNKDIFYWDMSGSVYSIQYFLNGQYIAAGFSNSLFTIFDLQSKRISNTIQSENRACLDFCISKDQNYIAIFWSRMEKDQIISNGLVKIFSLEMNRLNPIYSIEHWQDNFLPINRMVFLSGDNLIALAGMDDNINIIDIRQGKHITKLTSHKDLVTTVSLNPAGTLLASGSFDGSIKFWDVRVFVTREDEPRISMAQQLSQDLSVSTYNPTGWPKWWQNYRIAPPEGMVPNPNFGRCLYTVEQRFNCQGLRLMGAKGLNAVIQKDKWYTNKDVTLGEWLTERGAVLKYRDGNSNKRG